MDWRKALDTLDLDDHFVFDDEIDPVFREQFNAIEHGYSNLPFEGDPVRREFDGQRSFICGFKKPRAKMSMDFHRTANDSVCRERIAIH